MPIDSQAFANQSTTIAHAIALVLNNLAYAIITKNWMGYNTSFKLNVNDAITLAIIQ